MTDDEILESVVDEQKGDEENGNDETGEGTEDETVHMDGEVFTCFENTFKWMERQTEYGVVHMLVVKRLRDLAARKRRCWGGDDDDDDDDDGEEEEEEEDLSCCSMDSNPGPGVGGEERLTAVSVRGACKKYGVNVVLDNLNMTVKKGTIYGLLGASGCGKTTLLSCIVGRRHLNTGEVLVLGGTPGMKGSGVPGRRVGYMPQETALYGEFTIQETMMYFGWMFKMSTADVKQRLDFLLTLLDLPYKHKLVNKLSGGQQRRVSFAAALLHDPELLILDEPTVGVDPLLRQNIWEHLVDIAKCGNKTIIITTHYIEEARQAHMCSSQDLMFMDSNPAGVDGFFLTDNFLQMGSKAAGRVFILYWKIGMMRSGRLLAESPPDRLMTRFGCDTLEEVFLQLSLRQDSPITTIDQLHSNKTNKYDPVYLIEESEDMCHDYQETSNYNDPKTHDDNADKKECCGLISGGPLHAMLHKNFLRIWRNPGLMVFIFGLPVFQVILFCLAVGRDPYGLKLAIVNHDMNSTHQECSDIVSSGNCSFQALSCHYLRHLKDPTIIKEFYPTQESANEAVRRGKAWGALYFTENFTDALVARIHLQEYADEETLDQSGIKVWLDMSNQQIGLMLMSDLRASYQNFSRELLSTCDINPRLAEAPIRINNPVYGTRTPSFTNFTAPGVVVVLIFFLGVALTVGTLIYERREGLLDRTIVAGVTPLEIMVSHVITQFVLMSVQSILLLTFTIYVFQVECEGSMFWVAVLTVLQGMSGMCFGFAISTFCEIESTAFQMAMGSFYPALLLSGTIWPLEGMHVALQYFSKCLPLTLPTTALRCLMARGWSIWESDIYLGFVACIIWILLFIALSILVMKIKKL
uniref:ABC transporter G family member 20 n=1 Tax=Timema monikensis TaxID=170555 RepID=A0A7R9E8C1_9NEOP|nr:unnamed protein product [Timema monikensis]